MNTSASLLRIRDKNQITLPKAVLNALWMRSPCHVEYQMFQDGIYIRPIHTKRGEKLAKIHRLGQSVKSVYKDEKNADSFINNLREEWSR